MTAPLVVVGAGICGAAAVRALRDEGYDGRLVLVGAEPHPPYERPPLSKEYLRGKQEAGELPLFGPSWYTGHDVETRFGTRVTALDPSERAVELDGGERMSYGSVLLAPGGRPRHLRGAEPTDRVLYLRTVEDADRIRSHLRPGARLVVVGAGFIGAEVAASARGLDVEVTVVEMLGVPLAGVLGEEIGRVYADIHREHGVRLRLGEGVEAVEETAEGVVVRTTAGATVEGDAVVIGVGIVPDVELAERAGLEVDDGILVDDRCRTSAEAVFAAGDAARHHHPLFGRPVRVEHYDNALKQGAAAARNMLGAGDPYQEPHWFWSDQYDVNLQYAGVAHGWDRMVVRGAVEDRSFSAFYLKEGVLVAALGVNRGREVRRAMKLIRSRARPDPSALRDEDVDLRRLAGAG